MNLARSYYPTVLDFEVERVLDYALEWVDNIPFPLDVLKYDQNNEKYNEH